MTLLTETNNTAIKRRVRAAAIKALGLSARTIQADFEHGQWWITHRPTGAQWSVVDAVGYPAINGFDFEQVTEPRE
jgi:hypothetical protein